MRLRIVSYKICFAACFLGIVALQGQILKGKLSVKPAPVEKPVNTLSGTWKLKTIVLASGRPLLPDMETELKYRVVVIDGETGGRMVNDQLTVIDNPDKKPPTLTCRQKAELPFTVSMAANHRFLHYGPILITMGADCGKSAKTTSTVPAGNGTMFEVSGDTLTLIDNAGGDGVKLDIFSRVKTTRP